MLLTINKQLIDERQYKPRKTDPKTTDVCLVGGMTEKCKIYSAILMKGEIPFNFNGSSDSEFHFFLLKLTSSFLPCHTQTKINWDSTLCSGGL